MSKNWLALVKKRESEGYTITPRLFDTLASVTLTVTHSCGHSWVGAGRRFLSGGTNCPGCSHPSKKKTTEQFIEEAAKIWDDAYDYSKVKYTGAKDLVSIHCRTHDVWFEQTPNNHLRGLSGCKLCSKENQIESQLAYHENNTLKTGEHYIDIFNKLHNNSYTYSLEGTVLYKTSFIMEYICPKHGKVEQSIHNHLQGKGCNACASSGKSKVEEFLYNFIKSFYGGTIIRGDRRTLNGLELDLYLPELNLAIEYNGTFWHLDKDHIHKTLLAKKQGITLIHIWEHDFVQKAGIVLSLLRNKIGLTPIRIYARNCCVVELSSDDARRFLDDNHIQGADNSKIYLGLEHKQTLIAVMSFSAPRFNKNFEWELVRFCSEINTCVVGGASKLLTHFERKYNPSSMISYADYSRSRGNLYSELGFLLISRSAPNYKVYLGRKLYSRYQVQKHKLPDLLETYDDSLSEKDNLINNGAGFLYDCGSLVFAKYYN